MSFTPDPSWIDVTDFGAVGDGTTDDRSAIMAAIATAGPGDTVYVPPGEYRLGDSLALGVSNTRLKGAGPASILRLLPEVYRSGICLPVPYPEGFDGTYNVDGVVIEDLTVDGNLNGENPVPGSGNYIGIFVRQADNPTIRRCVVRNWPADGISVSNGLRATSNLVIEDCLFDTCRRNGVHVGFTTGGVLRRCRFVNCPTDDYPVLGLSAGNGLDIEVEGDDVYGPPERYPFVVGFVAEDNVFERDWCNTAGAAIAIQPAYGYVDGVTVRRNVSRNHQRLVETTGQLAWYGKVAGVVGVTIADNWASAGPATATPDEYGMAVVGNALIFYRGADFTVTGNTINDRTEPGWYSWFAVHVIECLGFVDIAGNTFYMYDDPGGTGNVGIAQVHSSTNVTVTDNLYRTAGDVTVWDDNNTPAVVDSGNVPLPHDPHDLGLPTCTLDVEDGQVLASPTAVTVTASDAETTIDRVFFLVDGIPSGHLDAAPYTFTVDPDDYTAGDHVLSAMALDASGNLGVEAFVTVEVPAGAAVGAARLLLESGDLLIQEAGGFAILTESEADDEEPPPDPDPDYGVLVLGHPSGGVILLQRAIA